MKYPKVLQKCLEEQAVKVDNVTIPLDLTKPNPNGEEFDCLPRMRKIEVYLSGCNLAVVMYQDGTANTGSRTCHSCL